MLGEERLLPKSTRRRPTRTPWWSPIMRIAPTAYAPPTMTTCLLMRCPTSRIHLIPLLVVPIIDIDCVHSYSIQHSGPGMLSPPLLGNRSLVAHHFQYSVAHGWCAIDTTPLNCNSVAHAHRRHRKTQILWRTHHHAPQKD